MEDLKIYNPLRLKKNASVLSPAVVEPVCYNMSLAPKDFMSLPASKI